MRLDREAWGRALARARGRAGLSQEAVARAIGTNRVLLSYYESGKRQPPLALVAALAGLYGISIDELLGRVDRGGETAGEAELLYRAAPVALSQRSRAEIRRFLRLVEAYVDLIREVGGEPPGHGVSPLAPAAPQARRREAKRLAREFRRYVGLDAGPIDDLFRLVGDEVLIFRLALGSNLERAPSGFFYNHPQAGFCIVVNSDMTFGRQVFTLAHELAHAFFHSQNRDVVISMAGGGADPERFADLFAGELLVPEDALRGAIDDLQAWERVADPIVVIHLQRRFGVSYAALLVRLRQEGFLGQPEYDALAGISASTLAKHLGYPVNPADLGEHRLAPLDRFPDRMLRLVRVAVEQGKVTLGDAAETLGVSVEDIRLLLDLPGAGPAERRVIEDLEGAAHLG
jgi:Zn-dependent peptidase ImmA (M78 family)/transcriptional regulator with XRE-family HTH domain